MPAREGSDGHSTMMSVPLSPIIRHLVHIVMHEISEERLDYFTSGTRALHGSWTSEC